MVFICVICVTLAGVLKFIYLPHLTLVYCEIANEIIGVGRTSEKAFFETCQIKIKFPVKCEDLSQLCFGL